MNKRMFTIVGGFLLALSISSTALAETCEIKDWRWSTVARRSFVKIEGETTCRDGILYIRQYWHWRDKKTFAGVATAIINGYTFTALFDTLGSEPSDDKKSASISLKYDYKPSFFD